MTNNAVNQARGKTPLLQTISWALWDWGTSAFSVLITTFVFARYIVSDYFIDPDVVAGGEPDNLIHDLVFEFARPESTARSPFRAAGPNAPNYQPAIVAASTPGTSSIVITYRGADDAFGTNATPFSPNIDLADGKPFLQYSIKLVADVVTGAVPSSSAGVLWQRALNTAKAFGVA